MEERTSWCFMMMDGRDEPGNDNTDVNDVYDKLDNGGKYNLNI